MCIGCHPAAARRVPTVDIPRGASHDRCRQAVLDGLKARLDQLLRDRTRTDPRAYAAGLRDALLEAKVGLARMSEAVTATEQELTAERRQLDDAERRGRLAAAVPDQETVTIAARFSVRHRDRIEVLTRKLNVQRDELALAQREVEEMTAEVKRAVSAGGAGSIGAAWRDLHAAGAERPAEGEADHANMERRRLDEAIEAQLAYLKKKMGKQR